MSLVQWEPFRARRREDPFEDFFRDFFRRPELLSAGDPLRHLPALRSAPGGGRCREGEREAEERDARNHLPKTKQPKAQEIKVTVG